jgi:predicted GIY-YIG superfamily endonuclease
MFYTYVIESIPFPGELYRGHSSDLKQRVAEHNAGKCQHTSKHLPWKIKFYVAFETEQLAIQFERYLKTGSGHAFSKRHFGL